MFTKIPLKGGDEYDALAKWRKWHKYLDKSGAVKRAKQSYNRRFRRLTKMKLKEDTYENQ